MTRDLFNVCILSPICIAVIAIMAIAMLVGILVCLLLGIDPTDDPEIPRPVND